MPESETTTALCERCGARVKWEPGGNPDAKMLRRSKKPRGLCVNCATQDWMRNTYPINMMLAKQGPGCLAHQHMRDQFAEIMRGSHSDASPDEINWNLINENWDLPFAKKVKQSAMNPCSQKELDRISSGEQKEFDYSGEPGPSLSEVPLTITSFEQMNDLEPGLGDKFKSALHKQTNPKSERTVIMAKKPPSVTRTGVIIKLVVKKHKSDISLRVTDMTAPDDVLIREIIKNKAGLRFTIALPEPDKEFPNIVVEGNMKDLKIQKTVDTPTLEGLDFTSEQLERISGYIRGEEELKLTFLKIDEQLPGMDETK